MSPPIGITATNISSAFQLRIGCVPEHFSSPIYQIIDSGVFPNAVIVFHFLLYFVLIIAIKVNCPGGTGQMIQYLKEDKIDIAFALTEGLIANLVNDLIKRKRVDEGLTRISFDSDEAKSDNMENEFKIIGTYVSRPLTWSIASHINLKKEGEDNFDKFSGYETIKNWKIGVSRFGSGSHIIPFVLADSMGWLDDGQKIPFEFVVLNNINGLINGIKENKCDTFLWERFTTKPYYDENIVHHLSNITPPWPAFTIAATDKILLTKLSLVKDFLRVLNTQTTKFDQNKADNVEFIKDSFSLKEKDVLNWLNTVEYQKDIFSVDFEVFKSCFNILKKSKVILNGDNLNFEDVVGDVIFNETKLIY
ncbi:hypothetical protein HK099_006722 [Clydaea vesicula]|uniref:Ca3427-like PBP 2 domain-containing protein n=1 Tax=Clydaea vesicula TaxID=447962 RepID=A0AAD5U971_9FUNG|nr:hypothetical protein HK099_006722 [Clydaea vesicula]KAJ3396906.1 hypothetical protein HDU92_001479 [Lobulomyces angularis]